MFQTMLSVTNKIPLYCILHPAVYLTIFTCICSEELQAGCYACFPFVVRLFYFVRSVVALLSIGKSRLMKKLTRATASLRTRHEEILESYIVQYK